MSGIKELIIVSGKGGTGKTTITAALARLLDNKIIADCDVDAANLHIIILPENIVMKKEFIGGKKASININTCSKCDICRSVCNYSAISENYIVDHMLCEGCGACYFFCPEKAIIFEPQISGYYYVCSTKDNEILVYAELFPGEESSGKLIATVKNEARNQAKNNNKCFILIDGPPGIGCPVISSLAEAYLALIVTEPTPTAIHDLDRLISLSQQLKVRTAVVVNKVGINDNCLDMIKKYSSGKGIMYLGEVPYERDIIDAQRELKTILEFAPESRASKAIEDIYTRLRPILEV